MNILKQHTDYALRVMVNLAGRFGQPAVSTRDLAKSEDISSQFTAKILQKLHNAGLLESTMGPKGGFELSRPPEKITLRQIIEAVQGPVTTNKCSVAINTCSCKPKCPIAETVDALDTKIGIWLEEITLKSLL